MDSRWRWSGEGGRERERQGGKEGEGERGTNNIEITSFKFINFCAK